MPSPSDRIGDDRLREILAGCEGVTPGPWSIYPDTCVECEREGRAEYNIDQLPSGCHAMLSEHADAAHIARLDPQTVASIVAELLSHRERLAYRHDELVEAVSRPTKEPSNGK